MSHSLYCFAISILLISASTFAIGGSKNLEDPYVSVESIIIDTIPLQDRYGDFITDPSTNPFDIQPSIIKQEVEYDPATNSYLIFEKIGEEYYRTPSYMTFEEFLEWDKKEKEKAYFQRLSGVNAERSASGRIDPFSQIDIKDNLVNKLFGGNEITINPRGFVDITFGLDYSKVNNPNIPRRNQVQGPFFDFDMDPQLNLEGKIGEKLNLNFNYNPNATFDFDDVIKIDYNTELFSEDDIIKKIEAGDVSLPLKSELIQGSQKLFGLKTELQFGHLKLIGVASQQRSENKNLKIKDGAIKQEFEIEPYQYDENRHFFLAQYFRNNYERALEGFPKIQSLVKITNIEVWVSTNQNSDLVSTSEVVAFSDLGEPDFTNYVNDDLPSIFEPSGAIEKNIVGVSLPYNEVSSFYESVKDLEKSTTQDFKSKLGTNYNITTGQEYTKKPMRRLSPSEYTLNPDLGFITLRLRLDHTEVLAVSYKYTYANKGNRVFEVGQSSDEGRAINIDTTGVKSDGTLIVKMLKPENNIPGGHLWDLMMKNIYSLNTSNLSREDFLFDIFYKDNLNPSDKRFIPEDAYRDEMLLSLFGLDRLNSAGDPQMDGVFDFVPGITVNTNTGSIIFPKLEPFGSSLLRIFDNDSTLFKKYGYPELYDQSPTVSKQSPEKNKFVFKGTYKSSTSSEINLGFSVPEGSVTVRAGSKILQEGVDYDINYGTGRIKILNDAYLQSGVPIDVDYEDRGLNGFNQKTMLALRAEYEFSDHLNVGGTYMRLFERPYTEKINIGSEPINNRMFGLDVDYSKEVNAITRLVDKLPFYSTDVPSNISFYGEVAVLKPGHSSAINPPKLVENGTDIKGGVVSIDDFEGASSSFGLGFQPNQWKLASKPVRIDETAQPNTLEYGYNRARLNWIRADNRAIQVNDNSDPYTRIVRQDELFDRQIVAGQLAAIYTFDLAYYPNERGPYNFVPPSGQGIFSGLEKDPNTNEIRLKDPESRWAGITRNLPNTDFEASNYEYIEFWMLNPFIETDNFNTDGQNDSGELIFNLGLVSEDILNDGKQFYENNIPVDGQEAFVDETVWGNVPDGIPLIRAFNQESIQQQDLGLDGLDDDQEKRKYEQYVSKVADAFGISLDDPSGDNFVSYLDPQLQSDPNLLNRYKFYNNPQGNAPDGSSILGTGNSLPDTEDLDGDRSPTDIEGYYKYEIDLQNEGGEIAASTKYITDIREITTNVGTTEKWYRFQIPIKSKDAYEKVGEIDGFRTIKFIRMYMKGFKTPKVFRMAEFEIVRNQWRRLPSECGDTNADLDYVLDEVGIQENGNKKPFRYVSPIGIKQERINSGFADQLQDENAMKLVVNNIDTSCQARVYKFTRLDIRTFERLQMFVHAEKISENLEDGDLSIFLRLGKDFENNYYEYELPLVISDENNISGNPTQYAEEVWKNENTFNFALSEFTELKKLRNKEGGDNRLNRFVSRDPDVMPANNRATVSIKGNPTLGDVETILIGIRSNVDNASRSAEIWVNELRLNGIEEKGGVAALARMDIQLADLGDISMSGKYTSVGWGSIEEKTLDRAKKSILEYNVASSLDIGKFMPEKWNIRVPFYTQYSKAEAQEEYDPYELDLTVAEVLEYTTDPKEVEDVKDRSKEQTTIKTFNFTNVKKDRGADNTKTPKPWDIENVSMSYGYTNTEYKDQYILKEVQNNQRGGLDYTYSTRTKYLEPFKNVRNKNLRIIKEINFNYLPNSFTFGTQLNKFSSEKKYRLPKEPEFVFNDQRFDWVRRYGLNWDFTRALKFSFIANADAIVNQYKQVGIKRNADDRDWVDEFGDVQARAADPNVRKEYLRESLKSGGRMKAYNHNFNIKFTLPIRYLPGLDFINMKMSYDANYAWSAGSLLYNRGLETDIGNTIQNSQRRSFGSTFNLDKLYNKFSYTKGLAKAGFSKGRKSKSKKDEEKGDKEKEKKDESRKRSRSKKRTYSTFEKIFVRPFLMIRKVRFDYAEDLGTVVPGYLDSPRFLGLSDGFKNPGWGFVLGVQPDILSYDRNKNWLYQIADRSLISKDIYQTSQVIKTQSWHYDTDIELKPWKDFEIDISFNKEFENNHSENFLYTTIDSSNVYDYYQQSPFDIRSINVSYMAMGTLFKNSQELFNDFSSNRQIFSSRYGAQSGSNEEHEQDGTGYIEGFGKNNSDVQTNAFLATYTGRNPGTATLDFIDDYGRRSYVPRPNWTLDYSGLSKAPWFSTYFSNISLKHGYQSHLTVNSMQSNLQYNGRDPFTALKDNNNYYTRFNVPTVVISEGFEPLFGLDLKSKKGWNFGVSYARTRTLSLTTGDIAELREDLNTVFSSSFGWTLKDVNIRFLTRDKSSSKRSSKRNKDKKDKETTPRSRRNNRNSSARTRELSFNLDVGYGDNVSNIYKLDYPSSDALRGTTTWNISPSADYDVNKYLSMRLYFNYSSSDPKRSDSYKVVNMDGGVTARLKLAN